MCLKTLLFGKMGKKMKETVNFLSFVATCSQNETFLLRAQTGTGTAVLQQEVENISSLLKQEKH